MRLFNEKTKAVIEVDEAKGKLLKSNENWKEQDVVSELNLETKVTELEAEIKKIKTAKEAAETKVTELEAEIAALKGSTKK